MGGGGTEQGRESKNAVWAETVVRETVVGKREQNAASQPGGAEEPGIVVVVFTLLLSIGIILIHILKKKRKEEGTCVTRRWMVTKRGDEPLLPRRHRS
jgi:hypothetical protein